MWPLPHGVSYNSYLIADQKTALIDTVEACYFDSYLEKIRAILGRVAQARHLRFDTLFAPDAPKGEVIVTFVALLELLRLRHVTVTQTAPFGELWVDAIPEGTPDAHLPLPAFDEDA